MVAGAFYPLTGLFETIIKEVYAEKQRKHEQRMKELQIIADSSLRDAYVQQLLLDKFLAPVDNAQHQIQNTAKHAQYLAETFSYYYQDHGATKEEAKEICHQLRILAIKISQVDSLYELKVIYQAATLFVYQMSNFQHQERKYSLERAIRKNILDVLNTCIAVETNFQRRVDFMRVD
ncbi:hypothetical protein H6F74_09495 [Trichocoleus sp. FACHB-90]|nr:hypothetical protein [Trichocoleus sp. FACHB-90]